MAELIFSSFLIFSKGIAVLRKNWRLCYAKGIKSENFGQASHLSVVSGLVYEFIVFKLFIINQYWQ